MLAFRPYFESYPSRCLLALITLNDGTSPTAHLPPCSRVCFSFRSSVIADLKPDAASWRHPAPTRLVRDRGAWLAHSGEEKPSFKRSKPRRSWPYLVVAFGLCVLWGALVSVVPR